MSYNLIRTDGTTLINLGDGYIDATTGVNLVGRNTPAYGDALNENFIRLVENFAGERPPTESIAALNAQQGTVWWDTLTKTLRVYDGTNWNAASGRIASDKQPPATLGTATLKTGDQWYDTVNQQLNQWNGTAWILVGPAAKASYGKSGVYVETILDPAGSYHIVTNTYKQGNLLSIASYDAEFTPLTAIAGFTTIKPGINLSTVNSGIFNATAANSSLLNNITPESFARRDQANAFTSDVSVAGNIHLTNANVSYSSNSLNVENYAVNGNVNLYVNSAGLRVNALRVDATTGLLVVKGDPVNDLGVATRRYVDNTVDELFANLTVTTGRLDTALSDFTAGYLANVTSVISSFNYNLNNIHTMIDANVLALSTLTNDRLNFSNVYLNLLQSEVTALDNYVTYLAPIDSPAFTGNATAPNVAAMNTYISSLQGSTYQVSLVSPLATGSVGTYLTQVLVSTPWHANTGYPIGSVVYDSTSGNSYSVLGNVYANAFSRVSPSSIQYVFTGTNTTTANFRISDSVSATNIIPVTIVSGGLNFGYPSIVRVNGVDTSNYFTGLQLISTGLAYTGLGDNSDSIATTAYVDATANLVYGGFDSRIRNEIADRISSVASAVAPLAPIASPIFTGTPTVPTKDASDNSTAIASTEYVTRAINDQRFRYTVSNSPPSGGADGDFWFQVS
jgi:hypothetical protein